MANLVLKYKICYNALLYNDVKKGRKSSGSGLSELAQVYVLASVSYGWLSGIPGIKFHDEQGLTAAFC